MRHLLEGRRRVLFGERDASAYVDRGDEEGYRVMYVGFLEEDLER